MEHGKELIPLERPVLESQHFKVGTWILCNNQRAEVLAWWSLSEYVSVPQMRLIVRWEDGRMGSIKPRALNRR